MMTDDAQHIFETNPDLRDHPARAQRRRRRARAKGRDEHGRGGTGLEGEVSGVTGQRPSAGDRVDPEQPAKIAVSGVERAFPTERQRAVQGLQ